MSRGGAWSLGDAILIAVIVLVLMGVTSFVWPSLGVVSTPAGPVKNSTNLRAVHQGAVIYATDNNGYLPGLGPGGELLDASVEGRFQLLLEGRHVDPARLIHPFERHLTPWSGGPLTTENYSYAALEVSAPGRREEWRDNGNSQAVMYSDRAIGPDMTGLVRSLWSNQPRQTGLMPARFPGHWVGTVVFGDSHVEFLYSHVVLQTRYMDVTNKEDNLFLSETEDGFDGFMIHTGR